MRFAHAYGVTCIVFCLIGSIAPGQAPTAEAPPASSASPLPKYEVASIRENTNPNPAWNMYFTADGVHAMDVTLMWALHEAYGIADDDLWSGGPAWINQKRFDIEAKYDVSQFPKQTLQERQAMLQQLLADRFKLVVHHETKEFPLYALVEAKGGPKFEEAKADDLWQSRTGDFVCHVTLAGRGVFGMKGCTMTDFAQTLYRVAGRDLDRRIVDQTDLKGRYSIELHWAPVNTASPTANPETESGAEAASGPSLFTAIKEQLGLELKPIKGPLDTIVIDHAEMPTEN
jgi:uncharacterized protein (TIGR03435 family)